MSLNSDAGSGARNPTPIRSGLTGSKPEYHDALLQLRARGAYDTLKRAALRHGVTNETEWKEWAELDEIDQSIWRDMAEYIQRRENNAVLNDRVRQNARRARRQ